MVGSLESGRAAVLVTRLERDGALVLRLDGKLMGGAESDPLREEIRKLLEHGAKRVVINLTHVPWMNSAGLGVLLAGFIQLRKAGGELRFVGPQERVRGILMTTKLERMIETHDTEEEALASFRK